MIDVIVQESIEAGYLEKLVLKPKIVDLFFVDHGKADLLELYVSNNNLIGKTVGELSPIDDYFICDIHDEDNGNISIATSDTVLKENCRISLLVKSESISKVLISSPNNGGIAFVRDNNGRRQSRSESCICINQSRFRCDSNRKES